MSTNKQETVSAQRERYLARELTHQEYYEWLSAFIGIGYGLIPFSSSQVNASKDEHLNDLPLSAWDRMDHSVRQFATGLSWSLSDTVCCLKALARKRRREESSQS